jgi:hypothetical protein
MRQDAIHKLDYCNAVAISHLARHLSRLVQMDILFLDVTDSGKNAKNPLFGMLLDLAHAVTQEGGRFTHR